jgi:hypothetical protein
MQKPTKLEFSLVRYVPDAVKGESVNIGVVVLDGGETHLRFTKDWRHVRALDPAADVETLQALEDDLNAQLTRGVLDRATLLAKWQDYLTNGVEFTPLRGVLAEDAAAEVETLARIYLGRRRAGTEKGMGRAAIFVEMKNAFERAGVWALMSKKIAAAPYTHRGDPLKIDCGYRPNGVINMFHAVSLAGDADAAKILAYTFPEVREGIARVEKADTELTAIVERDLDPGDEQVAFALAVLEKSRIATASTLELPDIAERARSEMRV